MNKLILFILAGILLITMFGISYAVTSQTTTASITVNEFLSVTLSNVPVNFPSMDPGETQNASVGTGFPLTAAIGGETNVNTNVTTEANQTNFVSGSNNFAVGNMSWSNTSAGTYTPYSTLAATVCKGKAAGQTCDIFHRLTIPEAQAAGTYQVGVKVSAIKT